MPTPRHKFNENVEMQLAKMVIDNEYRVAQQTQQSSFSDFGEYVDLFDALRVDPEYDWMSNVSVPEFAIHMLVQSGLDVAQYFTTRDFVEVYIEDEGEQYQRAAQATKEVINRTLNQRHLRHFQKFVRAKTINHLDGKVYLHCWWDLENDRFNYEILDPRNVFTDKTYTYSIQDKKWVIIRDERTYQDLLAEAEAWGYFNLDLVKNHQARGDTETRRETRERDGEEEQVFDNALGRSYDRLVRYGLQWMTPDGKPGVNEFGAVRPSAELREGVTVFVLCGSTPVLIGFHEQAYKMPDRTPYKPLIRGLCYIHPTRDGGVGDGRYGSQLQKAIDDTINLSNDRTRLATIPTLKTRKHVAEDTDTIYMEPGHIMELENPEDVQELVIRDNIRGAMQQYSVFSGKMQEAHGIFPQTAGRMPEEASQTATAFAGSEQRTNQRTNYKSLAFEYTVLCGDGLYWMIQQMTWQFAGRETAMKLLGEKVRDFDPTLNYTYKPLSQSIESEQSKSVKSQRLLQLLQLIIQVQHPKTVPAFNYVFTKISELMGDEYATVARVLLDENIPILQQGQQAKLGTAGGASNQYQIPQSTGEQVARNTASERNATGY